MQFQGGITHKRHITAMQRAIINDWKAKLGSVWEEALSGDYGSIRTAVTFFLVEKTVTDVVERYQNKLDR